MKILPFLITIILFPLLIHAQPKEGEESTFKRIESIEQYVKEGGMSENGELLIFYQDEINFIAKSEWEEHPEKFFDPEKLKAVAILGGDISERMMQFFSLCENLEHLELGEYIDGVFIEEGAVKIFPRFKKLKVLAISIYNLDDKMLETISRIKSLEYLEVMNPNILALPLDLRDSYQRNYLTDDSSASLKALENLKSLSIRGSKQEPSAKFSAKTLTDLLSMDSLESLEINKFCFEKSEWPAVMERMPNTLKLK